jgi:beta-galactosidase
VYRDAVVFVNGEVAAHLPSGYGELEARLDDFLRYGEENVVHVECRTGADSRWYSGAGIYRDVTLFVADLVHVALDGLRVTTPEHDVVLVDVTIENETTRRTTAEVVTELLDGDTIVASDRQPVTIAAHGRAIARARMLVDAPRPWDLDDPHLYTCRTRIGDDVATSTFGIRSITVDPRRGFRLNGETIKMRGACIHHDNGVLGAATFPRAEERRVETLKAAGFNALRMAHHPASRPLLDACDRLGMLVMDEAWDMWRDAKRDQDYAMHFPLQWQHDLESMVAKDRNHPSVVLYSIGNEIPEIGNRAGAAQGRAIVEHLRILDPTRPITCGANLWLPLLAEGELLNEQMTIGAERSEELAASLTEESFAVLDVAGYNYADHRFEGDRERYPNRVIVGSETWPAQIDRGWRLVLDNDHVIGDFTWTGWDYLGEVGIGRVEYVGDPERSSGEGLAAGYPWRYAGCGDIDVTGHRLPISYYREIVFGLRSEPYVAVRPPSHHGAEQRFATPWSWSTAVESWTWTGDEGRPVTVEIYADADEVELLQDGRSIGHVPIDRFRAELATTYTPGELVAVAYREGAELGRTALSSATDDVQLRATIDREHPTDVAFVTIELVDDLGRTSTATDVIVEVTVEGPAVLQGLGSAAPVSDESFLDARCSTYRGRALAVVRPTGTGPVTVAVTTDGLTRATATFTVL